MPPKLYTNTQCRKIHSIDTFGIRIVILQFISEWQPDKVDLSGKKADFSTFIGCRVNVPLEIKKLNYKCMAKPSV